MKKIMLVLAVISLFYFNVQAGENKKTADDLSPFLIITGSDLQRPYEIIDGLIHAKAISTCIICSNPFKEGIIDALKESQELGKKYGGDALINTTVQLVIYPNKQSNDDIGQVVVFGTLVKYKPQK